ncbi:MAG: aldehyde dehydrogenase family protein [Cyclobacteriaceae bacterium]|nr:aldehyde dehydrogenase family protein [Cyclobacteriaceae bacterium]
METISASRVQSAVRDEIRRIFSLQQNNQQRIAETTARERKEKLDRLAEAVLKYRIKIQEALYKDFRKHPSEVDLFEIYKVTSDIKHTKSHLTKWMKPKRVSTPLSQLGASSSILYEPKGVVLIISPWNYPVNLTFGPLVSAIAAGNCVMLKPSEHTPHASAIMKKIVKELFDEAEVALVEGDVEVSSELLKLPFNHIFFTGAPEIGKVVMKAAAENLASVTLELGGKSPTIVDETSNLKTAAQRVAISKWLNNGQTCIAPDYVFVHQSVAEEFLANLKESANEYYSEDASRSESYNRIVNNRHFKRIEGYFQDALSKGAQVAYGGKTDSSQDYFGPTIMTNIPEDSELWEKEIFGPILPFIVYADLQEVIDKINAKEKPLSMYIYSNNKSSIDRIIRNTRAGATVVNHGGLHFFNNNLPFGGTNNSGIGKGNGFFGFEAFSNARAILKQWLPISGLDSLIPPYNAKKQKLIDLTIKWF